MSQLGQKRAGILPFTLPFLGFGKPKTAAALGDDLSGGLVTATNPRSPVAEAYRQLRTNIQFASHDRARRTIMVTSTGADEGKTTTLANLAVTIAQTGSTVVLVDCDLRRPTLHEPFHISNSSGLTNLFIAGVPLRSVVQETGIAGLRLLPSGPLPPNPSELLGGARMLEVIEALKEEADFVLFDTPPINAVTDAAVLATRMDAVLLVLRAGHTRRELALRARQQLEKVQANLLGVVLTNAHVESGLSPYYAQTR
jgi:capsular exopolysaccharide synthesis family protein